MEYELPSLHSSYKLCDRMHEDPDTIGAKAKEMAQHLVCVFLDSTFLGIWAILNITIGKFIEGHHLPVIDQIVLGCLQVLFGISTLAPICVWTYKDIRIMFIRADREINASRIEEATAPPPNLARVPSEVRGSNVED
jgi:hypothetical protein